MCSSVGLLQDVFGECQTSGTAETQWKVLLQVLPVRVGRKISSALAREQAPQGQASRLLIMQQVFRMAQQYGSPPTKPHGTAALQVQRLFQGIFQHHKLGEAYKTVPAESRQYKQCR